MELPRSFCAYFVLRLINAFMLQTFYVPDEYWQSLEVAHRLVFGYGHLTWEWEKRIRGYFHPLLFVPAYSTLRFLHLDSPAAVMVAPKVVQAIFAAVGDVYFHRFARRVVGIEAANWATFAYLTNYFALFSLPRTLSNSLETILSVIALSHFPWTRGGGDDNEGGGTPEEYDDDDTAAKHVALAALTVVVRPTAIITWIPLWLSRLLSKKIEREERRRFFLLLLRTAFFAAFASVVLDSYCYGEFTFVPWEFLKFNVFRGVADFYGSHPFHWYITQGFPVILGPHFLPFLAALRLIWNLKFSSRVDLASRQYRQMQIKKELKQRTKREDDDDDDDKSSGDRKIKLEKEGETESGQELVLLKMLFWILAVYSFLGHKEFRFIFTTLPLAMCLVGRYFASLDGNVSCLCPSKKTLTIGLVTLLNFGGFFYLASYHQRGNLDAVRYLSRRLKDIRPMSLEDVHVLFLLPCHQHPYYSHVHLNVEMRFLHCEPNFESPVAEGSSSAYVDEAEQFFADPESWYLRFLDDGAFMPTHVIVSPEIGRELTKFFSYARLTKTRSFFHSHWEMDERMGTTLDFYERDEKDEEESKLKTR